MIAGLVCTAALGQAKDFYVHDWTKIHANKHFWAEGGAVGDFNRDGHGDLVVGPYWYAGPDFKARHEIYPAVESFEMKDKETMLRELGIAAAAYDVAVHRAKARLLQRLEALLG